VHDDRDPAAHPIDDLLGDLFALVDFHHHALAVGAQRKEAVHAGVEIKINDRVGYRVVNGAVAFERDGHGHQDSFNFFIARHKTSSRMKRSIQLFVPISQRIS
jgi:hypothetical protein